MTLDETKTGPEMPEERLVWGGRCAGSSAALSRREHWGKMTDQYPFQLSRGHIVADINGVPCCWTRIPFFPSETAEAWS